MKKKFTSWLCHKILTLWDSVNINKLDYLRTDFTASQQVILIFIFTYKDLGNRACMVFKNYIKKEIL